MKRGQGIEIYFRESMVRFGHDLDMKLKENPGMTQIPGDCTR